MRNLSFLISFLLLLLLLAARPGGVFAQQYYYHPNIVEIAASDDDFSTLVELLGAADLVDTLSGEGPFTVFAPTNDAFAALPPKVVDFLLDNPDELERVLLYHVVAGAAVFSDDLERGPVETAGGSDVFVRLDPIRINDSRVIFADIKAKNGVVHVIDEVLIPPTLRIPPGRGRGKGRCYPTETRSYHGDCDCGCTCCGYECDCGCICDY